MGQHLLNACLAASHPTAVLVQPGSAAGNPGEMQLLLESFEARGVYIGDMNEHETLVAACKQADVVISSIGHPGPEDLEDGQLKIVAVIKEAGNIKLFVPSEYGCDVDQAVEEALVEPARSILLAKHRVRETVRAAGSPTPSYAATGVTASSYHASATLKSMLLRSPTQPSTATRKHKAFLHFHLIVDHADRYDGAACCMIFVDEKDMSMVVMRAVEDPRTLNKILYVRPPANICSYIQPPRVPLGRQDRQEPPQALQVRGVCSDIYS
ncbi:hypothetical protein EJB05_30466, partial [Eragrostis curvula]